jgi:hypothetical protein
MDGKARPGLDDDGARAGYVVLGIEPNLVLILAERADGFGDEAAYLV